MLSVSFAQQRAGGMGGGRGRGGRGFGGEWISGYRRSRPIQDSINLR